MCLIKLLIEGNMKKTINVKLVAAFCLAGTLAVAAASAVVPANTVVNANSGPTHWDGVTASGTIFPATIAR